VDSAGTAQANEVVFKGRFVAGLRRMLVPWLLGLTILALGAATDAGVRAFLREYATVWVVAIVVSPLLRALNARNVRLQVGTDSIGSGRLRIAFADLQGMDVRAPTVSERILGLGYGPATPLALLSLRRPPSALVLRRRAGRAVTVPLVALSAVDALAAVHLLAARGAPFVQEPDKAVQPTPATSSLPRLGVGVAAGAGVAVAGAAAWGVLIFASGLEVGIVASLLGAAVGATVRTVSGGRSKAGGAGAASLALFVPPLGVFLGSGLRLQQTLQSEGLAMPWGLHARYFATHLGEFFGTLDLLFLALAVYAAWRLAGPVRFGQVRGTSPPESPLVAPPPK